jgi:hypothetical protein
MHLLIGSMHLLIGSMHLLIGSMHLLIGSMHLFIGSMHLSTTYIFKLYSTITLITGLFINACSTCII